jgi:hypothetical protein
MAYPVVRFDLEGVGVVHLTRESGLRFSRPGVPIYPFPIPIFVLHVVSGHAGAGPIVAGPTHLERPRGHRLCTEGDRGRVEVHPNPAAT